MLALVTIFSLLLFIVASWTFPKYGFYLLPTRAWELAAGGMLAATDKQFITSLPIGLRNVLASLGLLLILTAYFLFPTTQVISWQNLIPVLGSVLFIGFASGENLAGRLLSSKPIVFIGKISYSLYLWHWPVIVLSRRFAGDFGYGVMGYLAAILPVIILLSIASYWLVEVPTRNYKPILRLVTVLFAICVSIVVLFRSDLINVKYPLVFSKTRFYGLYYNINPNVSPSWQKKQTDRLGVFVPLQRPEFKMAYAQGGIPGGSPGGNRQLFLLGDSHGGMWAKVVDEIASELNVKASIYTINGTDPFFKIPYVDNSSEDIGSFTKEQWNTYARHLIREIRTEKPRVLLVACRWSIRIEKDAQNLTGFIHLAEQLGTRVIILNDPPVIAPIEENNATQYLSFLGLRPNGRCQYLPLSNNQDVDASNTTLSRLASKFSNCELLDVNKLYRKGNFGMVINGKSVLYFDDDHLSYQGTLLAKKVIKAAICRALEQHPVAHANRSPVKSSHKHALSAL